MSPCCCTPISPTGQEAGQKTDYAGPDSWQFWNKQNEAGQNTQAINRGGRGGNSGPDSWQFWGPNRQLLAEKKGECCLACCPAFYWHKHRLLGGP
jgi:hypothetical protein